MDRITFETLTQVGNTFRSSLRSPSAFAQLGTNAGNFHQEVFFQKRYGRFLAHARQQFEAGVRHSFDCKTRTFNRRRQVNSIVYSAGDAYFPFFPAEGGTNYGDPAQGWWERVFSLGNFSVVMLDNIQMREMPVASRRQRVFLWKTKMCIVDDLGLDASNSWLYYLFGWLAPPRRVVLAEWEIGGELTCECR